MIIKHMIKFSDINDQLNSNVHVRIGDSGNVYTDVLVIKHLGCGFIYNNTLENQSSYGHISQYTLADNFQFSKIIHGVFNHFSRYTERHKSFKCINGRCF